MTRHGALICALAIALFASEQTSAETATSPIDPGLRFLQPVPRIALPEGEFDGWCGEGDLYFIKHAAHFSLRHWDGRPVTTVAIEPNRAALVPRCDESAENIQYRTENEVIGFNLKTGARSILLAYKHPRSHDPIFSLAPNFRYIAYRGDTTDPSQWTSDRDLVRFEIKGPSDNLGRDIYWKSDSSMLLTAEGGPMRTAADARNYVQTIRVLHTDTRTATTGKLPRGYSVRDGTFISGGRELLLLVRPADADEAPGTVFRCQLEAFACRRLIADVDDVSMNERGDVVRTKLVYDRGRPKPEGGTFHIPNRYRVEVSTLRSRTVPMVEIPGEQGFELKATISPSGRFLAITWRAFDSRCPAGTGRRGCKQGLLVNLGARQ